VYFSMLFSKPFRCLPAVAVVIVVSAMFVPMVSASTIEVPSQASTIQAGIDVSSDGDTVLVDAGVYTGEGNRDIDFHGKGILLLSQSGADLTIIDCQGSETNKHRGFYFHTNEDSTSTLDGFTITHGFGLTDNSVYHLDAGGGMYLYYSAPRLRNLRLTFNQANLPDDSIDGFGGGLYADYASPILENCSFSEAWRSWSLSTRPIATCSP
jgi:hypothetical protein